MEIKQSNPNALKTIELHLQEMGNKELKVGWFPGAVYENGTPVAAVAQIQEFGAPSRSIPPRPFMRPTVFKETQAWMELAAQGAKAAVDGKTDMKTVFNLLGVRVQDNIKDTIESITSPPLSLITLMARKLRRQGETITGATIGRIVGLIKAGKADVSGVPDKPLQDTFQMTKTLNHTVEG